MGRRRRKIIRRAPRPFPKVFYCPLCNQQAVTVVTVSGYVAEVSCGNCGVSHQVPWYRSSMPVDAYSTWYDIIMGRVKEEEVAQKIERLRVSHEQVLEEAELISEETPIDEAVAETVDKSAEGEVGTEDEAGRQD
ncbi:MAG: transcription elongation factor 1 family protein [Thaumarchaeota archaeon]|nr:transcription elongation factor 1 family protein [Candidatus Calditenuaceae archaeon]MDW8187344.1 transcription elongation factor 1 family protein [Nitrososphaerota archaeon]